MFPELIVALGLFAGPAAVPKETIDLMSFEAPAGWTREVKAGEYTVFTRINKEKRTFCRIFVMANILSKGSLQADFDEEWKNLVVDQYHPAKPGKFSEPGTKDGWQMKSGTVPYAFGDAEVTARLTTMSGYGNAASIVALSSSDDFAPAIRKFLDSVEMKKMSAVVTPPATTASVPAPSSKATATTSALGTTNFDDGWVSNAREDFVEVSKGTTRVLIHYPNKKADAYNSVLLDGLKTAWEVLVAGEGRYGAIRNLEFKPAGGWESIEFAEADSTEKATGSAVHVVLFKKNYNNGSGRYLEFVTPNKAAFEKEFGAYGADWEKLEHMANYNKFIVSAAELQGKWTSNFSGAISYVNAVTGFSAGMDTHASNENFQFGPGNSYKWDLGVQSGMVGNIKFQSVKSKGQFSVPNGWHVTFSDIEGKPRTFDASFSHIKGLKVLWLDSTPYAKAD